MTISEMIHEIPHMRYRLESAKHKETLDEIEEVLRHHKEINEVLDKIRAEIEKAIDGMPITFSRENADSCLKKDVAEIIGKYRAESGDEG